MGAQHSLETSRSRRVTIGAAIVVVLVGLASAVVSGALAPKGATTIVEPSAAVGSSSPSTAEIFVHVLGAVRNPGLFQLREGDRGVDAIAAAGGFAKKADEGALNLARFVSDGEQIVVPTKGETAAAPGGPAAPAADGKVNLNTADAALLETLPRVGPAMSARIIAWRDANGRFSSVDDLTTITGIGDKTFAELKDLVTV